MAELLEGAPQVRRHEDGRVEILSAPPRIRVSLEFLAAADPVVVKVAGDRITLAGQVEYQVVGWDSTFHCLLADVREDRRPNAAPSQAGASEAMSTASMPGLIRQ